MALIPRPSDLPPHDVLMEERYEQLVKEFSAIDANSDKQLSFEEVYDFLSNKSESQFSLEYCRGLFNQMDKDQNSFVTINEFVWTYVETETALQKDIVSRKARVSDIMKHIDENKKKLITAEATEKMNEDVNIMEGSMLTVVVIEAINLPPVHIGTSSPFVELVCEKQVIETKVIEENLNPQFDESFTFRIVEGTGELSILVKHWMKNGEHRLIGKGNIRLETLRDQMKKDKMIEIYGNGRPCGRVHLELVWVWSKVKYHTDILEQWAESLEIEKTELQEIEAELELFQAPFGALVLKKEPRSGNMLQPRALLNVQYVFSAFGRTFDVDYSTLIVLYVFFLVAVLSMYFRADFATVSCI